MPLPLTVSCFSKIQIGLPFWYRLTRVVLDKGQLNGCVCVCKLLKTNKDTTFPETQHCITRYIQRRRLVCLARSTTVWRAPAVSPVLGRRQSRPSDEARSHCQCSLHARHMWAPRQSGSALRSSDNKSTHLTFRSRMSVRLPATNWQYRHIGKSHTVVWHSLLPVRQCGTHCWSVYATLPTALLFWLFSWNIPLLRVLMYAAH